MCNLKVTNRCVVILKRLVWKVCTSACAAVDKSTYLLSCVWRNTQIEFEISGLAVDAKTSQLEVRLSRAPSLAPDRRTAGVGTPCCLAVASTPGPRSLEQAIRARA